MYIYVYQQNNIERHDTSAVSKINAIDLQTRNAQYRYQPSSDEDDDDFYDTRYTNPWFRNQPKNHSPPYRTLHDYSQGKRTQISHIQ